MHLPVAGGRPLSVDTGAMSNALEVGPYQHLVSARRYPPECGSARLALPIVTIVIAAALLYVSAGLAVLVLSLWALVLLGWLPVIGGLRPRGGPTPTDQLDIAEADLPSYTILLPVYGEANMLPQLAAAMRALDYPPDKLECLLLLEEDDRTTTAAAVRTEWPAFVSLLTVPAGQPQTKARACNIGLAHARGTLLVIYDAEDKPHPGQLREAAARFAAGGPTLACLQAPLHIRPQKDRWLEAQFALEYAVLFGFILPHMGRSCGALPLGGSSNHFRTDALRSVAGWDPFNLTEDADLGIRLLRRGLRIDTLNRPTLENAPTRLRIWHRQRTRWLSGHLQTCAMHALPHRAPPGRRLVAAAFLAVLVGRLAAGPAHALAWLLLIHQVRFAPEPIALSPWMTAFVAGLNLGLLALLVKMAPATTWPGRVLLALSHSLYWLMTVPALVDAMHRMARGDLRWLKTPHQPYSQK